MASRSGTALKDIPNSELAPSFDGDDDAGEQVEQVPAETAPETPESTPEASSEPAQQEQPAAEAPVAEVPADTQPATDTPPQEGWIPPHRLKEESDRRREAEANYSNLQQQFGQLQGQLAAIQGQLQPQQQPQAIDPYEDPAGYTQQQNAQILNAVETRLAQQSQAFAYQTHGRQAVDEAFQWARTLPIAEQNAIAASPDPYGECVVRKKQADALAEFGTDPEAYRQRVLEAALQDPDFVSKVQVAQQQQVQTNPAQQTINVPPSLSSAPAAADAKADAGQNLPMTDAELAADALAFDPYKRRTA